MSPRERQIRSARHRLWMNRWLHDVSWCLAAAAVLFAAVVLACRLAAWTLPLWGIGTAFTGGAFIGSVLWTAMNRETAQVAAARLDAAAGLRERLSSAHYCEATDDPFARAVVTDAERVSASLSARRHIRLVLPTEMAVTALMMVIAALMFLVPPGLFVRSEAAAEQEQPLELQRAKVAVKRQMEQVRKWVDTVPGLTDLKNKLDGVDRGASGKLQKPSDVRFSAIKKIDTLADAVKQKRTSAKYKTVRDVRRLFRGLKVPRSSDAPTQKLAKALARGDFKTAKEEVSALREQLATLKSEQDRELVAKMSRQLEALARQLETLSKNEQLAAKLAKKLQEAGVQQEDIQRLLEHLSKKDLDQIKKQLEKKGLSRPQIEKLAQQLQRRHQAAAASKALAQALRKGAQGTDAGQLGEAMAGLSLAADQLSELEMLEQEMNQLDAAMAGLQGSMNQLRGRCGMGPKGQGRGGRSPEQQTAVGFQTQRGKVHTGRGAIIGQFLFEGRQVKGEVTPGLAEVLSAAEHDASDRINRNRIPRQYHSAIKAYFSSVQRSIKEGRIRERHAKPDGDAAPAAKGKSEDDAHD